MKDAQNIAVFSCGVCANLCGTGGAAGLKHMKGLLARWGRQAVVSQCVNGCCSEVVMREAMDAYITSGTDALVMLACSGGVKAAFLCNPPLPVIAALDTLGSAVMSEQNSPVSQGVCSGCSQCVITYTAGVCPQYACPKNTLYGPCAKRPQGSTACVAAPGTPCVWTVIENLGGDLEAVKRLGRMRQEPVLPAAPQGVKPLPGIIKKTASLAAARFGWMAWIIRGIR